MRVLIPDATFADSGLTCIPHPKAVTTTRPSFAA
ncbi:hypothetical protein J2852_001555 [Azospirillum soli]|nr:hypothetical protein [Azospirillum soli]